MKADKDRQGGDSPGEDVVIVGSSLGGTMLASVLARQGVRTTLVSAETRAPAVAATIPFCSAILQWVSERYQVPEIANLAFSERAREHVAAHCPDNKRLGFVRHAPGRGHDPDEVIEFVVPSEHHEMLLRLDDCASYLAGVAAGYGATVRSADGPVEVSPQDDAVDVGLPDGTRLRARWVVDARGGGAGSSGASAAGAWVAATPYEDCAEGGATPWSQGALHHVCEEGWLSVLRFDGADDSRSVAVEVHPRDEAALESLPGMLKRLGDRYPALGCHLGDVADAADVEEFPAPEVVAAPSHRRVIALDETPRSGPLPGAAVSRAALLADEVAWGVLAAERGGAEAPEPADSARALDEGLGAHEQLMRSSAMASTRGFPFLNAFIRLWLLDSMLATVTLEARRKKRPKEASPLDDGFGPPSERAWWTPPHAGVRGLLGRLGEAAAAVGEGSVPTERASEDLFAEMRRADFLPPVFDFANPEARRYRLTVLRQIRTLAWLLLKAPKDVKRLVKG